VSADDAAPTEPQPCPACRGTGKVISNLGGSPSTVECPWCDGTGTLIPEHDAQARWRDAGEAEQPQA
jgi:DnaJ-class molecular chaperone